MTRTDRKRPTAALFVLLVVALLAGGWSAPAATVPATHSVEITAPAHHHDAVVNPRQARPDAVVPVWVAFVVALALLGVVAVASRPVPVSRTRGHRPVRAPPTLFVRHLFRQRTGVPTALWN